MQSFAEALKAYTRDHPFDAGSGDAETVLDQLYQAMPNPMNPIRQKSVRVSRN